MIDLEFSFEPVPWETMLAQIPEGGSIEAARFLAVTEELSEEALEDLLLSLEIRKISLDASQLPGFAAGEAAVRLRREAKLVQEGSLLRDLEENDPLRLYLEEIAALPAAGDVQLMAQAYARGQDMVMSKLTNSMLSRVVELSCAFAGRGVLLLDLIQEGSMGLWQAILSYQSGDFRSHADWYIRQYIAKALTVQARASGFGQRMKQAMEDYRAVDERLLSDLGRNATVEEIAEQLHMTPEETAVVASMVENARLLSRAKQETARPEEEDPEDEQHVEDTAYFQSRQRVNELLEGLTEQESKLVSLRFGLEGGLPLSVEETGRRLGLTPEEVVAQETAALEKMRKQ